MANVDRVPWETGCPFPAAESSTKKHLQIDLHGDLDTSRYILNT